MKLTDRLPDSVTVNGRRYPCDFDFRNVLNMMDTLENRNLIHGARIYNALRCVMKRVPRDAEAALKCVTEVLFQRDETRQKSPKNPVISLRQDADMIRAAFRQAYGIDLWTAKLHYITFVELLSNLPEGCRYSEVVSIRAREIPAPNKYNAKERENLMRLKLQYAIHLTEEEQEVQYNNDVSNIFRGLMAIAEQGGKSCRVMDGLFLR